MGGCYGWMLIGESDDARSMHDSSVHASSMPASDSRLQVLTQDPNVKAQVLREMELKREKAAEIFGAPTM